MISQRIKSWKLLQVERWPSSVKELKEQFTGFHVLQRYSAFILFALLMVINVIMTPNFFNISNLNNVITQICPIILCSMGMTLVISTGGIDLTVGAFMAVSGVVTAKFIDTLGLLPGFLLGVAICVAIGMITGFMVGKMRLQPMVITLALMIGVRGIAQVLNDGQIIYLTDEVNFLALGTYKIGGVIPIQIIPIILVVGIIYLIVEKAVLGRQIQAVGDSLKSSTLSGINTVKTLMIVYGTSAVLAATAGIFAAAKVGAADGSALGQLVELDAIAAVAIGGTPMSGGRSRVFGTILGALIMQLITLTVTMNNIPEAYARVIKAVIIVVAVYIQREE